MKYSNYKGKNIKKYSTGGIIGSTLSGVGSGAAIGSMFGPGPGTAIGAGIGLIGGLAQGLLGNSAENKQQALQERNDYINKEQLKSLDDASRLDNYYTNGYSQESLYSKGGMIPNVNTPSNTRKLGDGIQVTGNTTKDKINATVDGTPVKLDNKEIVVQYKGNPVVISDDLGEADKYRAELNAGGNPKQIADKYAVRAIMLNGVGGNKLQYGGRVGDPPLSQNELRINNGDIFDYGYGQQMQAANYNPLLYNNLNNEFRSINPNYMQQFDNTQTNNNVIDNVNTKNVIKSNKYNFNPNSYNVNAINPSVPITHGMVNPLSINKIASLSMPKAQYDINTTSPQYSTESFKASNPNIFEKVGQFANNNTEGLAQGASALGSIVSNIAANAQLQKTNIPRPYTPRYINRNINANAPIFEHQLHNVNDTINNLNNNVINNTSNSNVALSRLNSLGAKQLNAESSIYANQIADRNRIENSNIAQQNNFSLNNANTMNRYNQQQYASNVGKIQSNLALNGSTLSTINGLVNNMKKDKYQNEQLQAIAKQVGFDPNGNFDVSNLDSMSQAQLLKLIKQYYPNIKI